MPRITDRIADHKAKNPGVPFFSFEYFPPKTEAGVTNLCARMDKMGGLNPLWMDVTWGAGGSTSETTLTLCENALDNAGVDILMHLTCTNVTKEETREVLLRCQKSGIQNILALRGDPPKDSETWTATEGGFSYAVDLVKFIRSEFGDYFNIGVAAYPEGHLEAESYEKDCEYFVEKVAAGADFAVTQLFYDCGKYFDFCKKVKTMGVPEDFMVFPGLMPIQNYGGFTRMTGFCKTCVPQAILDRLAPIQDDEVAVKKFGIELGVEMGKELLAGGAPGLHLYTLNLETTATAIVREMGLVIEDKAQAQKPWRSSMGVRGAKEDVRPIFWANRSRSYVERTATWDDFPNGRWGASDSPAFGLFSKPPRASDKVLEERKREWFFDGASGLQEVFATFLEGGVKALPWCAEAPGDETVCIKKQLVRLCRSGLLTINSQPRVNGALSSDPLVGWGRPNGVVYQKAYCEFFCDPETLELLTKELDGKPSIQYMAVNRAGSFLQRPEGHTATAAVTWGVFPGEEIKQPTVVDRDSFLAWKDEAFALWSNWADAATTDAMKEHIQTIQGSWYLLNVVENNFVTGDLHADLNDILRAAQMRVLCQGA